MSASKWLWIIGGGLLQVPVVQKAHEMGYKTIVSDQNPKCACAGITDMFLPIDIFDVENHVEAWRALETTFAEFPDDRDTIDGVVAIGIDAPETQATLNQLIRPNDWMRTGVSPKLAKMIQSKTVCRQMMGYSGFKVPKFRIIKKEFTSNYVKAIWDEFSRKNVIVKPALASGSRGIKVFKEPYTGSLKAIMDIKPAFWEAVLQARKISRNGDVIVEEFLEFEKQYTVETLFDIHGTQWNCFITERLFDSSSPTLETGLIHPARIEPYMEKTLYQIAHNLAGTLGVTAGPFKLDIGLTQYGPVVIEATTRYSGGFDCQYVVPAATGKDIIRAAIECAVGRDNIFSALQPKWKKVALTKSLWPEPGRKIKLIDDDGARETPGVVGVFWRLQEGDIVERYTDCSKRACFIIAVGDTQGEAWEAMQTAMTKIYIELEEPQYG